MDIYIDTRGLLMIRQLSLLLLLGLPLLVNGSPVTDLKGVDGYERRSLIGQMVDGGWKGHRFSPQQGLELLQGLSGGDRYYAAKSLLGENRFGANYLPQQLTVDEIRGLLEGMGHERGDLIHYLADRGLPMGNFGVAEIRAVAGAMDPWTYERSLKALMGMNRLEKSYVVPTFSAEQVEQLLSEGVDRVGMIRYMADHAQLADNLSVADAEQMMSAATGMGRHDAVKALIGLNRKKQSYLQLPLSFEQAQQLLEGAALRSEMIRSFVDQGVYTGPLPVEQVIAMLEGVEKTDRFSSLKMLLGENQQKMGYLQGALSAAELEALLSKVSYRDQMVGLMADYGVIASPMDPAHAMQLLQGLERADRHDALRSLVGHNELNRVYLSKPLKVEEVMALMGRAAYRGELLGLMADQGLYSGLDADQLLVLIDGLTGDDRFEAVIALLGDNYQQQRYFNQPLSVADAVTVLERIARRKEVIEWMVNSGMLPQSLRSDEIDLLLGRLYGEEREEVEKLLKGEG